MRDEAAGQATRAEIAQHAREHYERLSMKACDWNSIVPQAIDLWEQHDSPCACITAQEAEDWIAGMSTLEDAGDRAAEANALILKLRNRKPCACGGREPLAVIKGGMTETMLDKAKRGPDHPFDEWTVGCRGGTFHQPVDVIILEASSASDKGEGE